MEYRQGRAFDRGGFLAGAFGPSNHGTHGGAVPGELNTLEIARLYYRLCSFDQAVPLLQRALEKAEKGARWNEYGEIVALLIRIRAERMEFDMIEKHVEQIEALQLAEPPSRLSYALGIVQYYQGDVDASESNFHAALRSARNAHDEGYALIGHVSCKTYRKKYEEAFAVIERLREPAFQAYPDLVVAALIFEAVLLRLTGRFAEALACLTQSQAHCQRESNVYMALNTMFGLAATYIEMREFEKAQEHLNLLHQLVNPKDLTYTSRQVQAKRAELQAKQAAASVSSLRLVEGVERLLYTPSGEKVDLKKQFVLVNLLKLLGEKGADGVTKEEMVNRLWKEDYHPLRHDNKVHATVLRLRKLIEPDLKAPQFILNAPDGYQLNPKVSFTIQGGGT